MPKCSDQQTTYLRGLGYNVISLPRAGIQPLSVAFLGKNRRLTELGYLPQVWTSAKAEPKPETGIVAQLGGQRTSKLDAKIGLDILGNLIGALGGDPIGIKNEFNKAHTLEFTFKNVERERVTALALGTYVTDGKLSSKNPFVERYFAPNQKLYVVTEVLKSSGFGVTAMASSTTGLDLQVPVIQKAASANGSIRVESKSQNSVEFEGTAKLPFAFIAARMLWQTDHWEVGDYPQPGDIHLGETSVIPPSIFGEPREDGAVLFGEELVDFDASESA